MKQLLNKLKNWLRSLKFSDYFVGFLVIINVLPVIAPILQSQGAELPAKIIYFIYSFMCHQIHWRSLHIYDHQCAWCSRDMAIWGALLITAVLIRIFKLKGINWYHTLPFIVPIALDGGIQTIATTIGVSGADPIYISSNLMRTITGAIFGIGLGMFLTPLSMIDSNFKLQKSRQLDLKSNFMIPLSFKLNSIKLALVSFVLLFIGYLTFLGLWSITSDNYLPSNALDSQVRVESLNSALIERRINGTCPVIIDPTKIDNSGNINNIDLFALDCFLSF